MLFALSNMWFAYNTFHVQKKYQLRVLFANIFFLTPECLMFTLSFKFNSKALFYQYIFLLHMAGALQKSTINKWEEYVSFNKERKLKLERFV